MIRVQDFKSIIDTGDIYVSETDLVTILAGQNESGKTSLLRALRFFEEGEYETYKDDDERLDAFPRVDITYKLTEEELNKVRELTNKDLAKYFKDNNFTFVRGDTKEADYEDLKYVTTDELTRLLKEHNESLQPEEESFKPFAHFNAIRPRFILYSSFVENILPSKASYDQIGENQAIKDFEKVYGINFQKLLDPGTTDQKRTKALEEIKTEASDSLNAYWNQKVSGEKAEYKYRIALNPQPTISESYVNFFVDQGDDMPLKVSQKSQGFQWFSGFILRLRAHESTLENQGLILLIDEPGQGLHEVAQQDVKNVIEEISSKSNIRVIYSTHQPILLGKEDVDFSRLLLVNRDKASGSTFKTISQLISSDSSLDALAPVRSAMGLVTITDPLNKKLTVITEGVTEFFYLKTFFKDKYTILPSAGVDQVPNIFAILYGWGIDARAIVDDDTQGRKAYNKIRKEFYDSMDSEDFLKNVLKITGSDGIENMISDNIITAIMADFEKRYDQAKTKVENINLVGKMIFAKSFYDRYHNKVSDVDEATKINFKQIGDFLTKT